MSLESEQRLDEDLGRRVGMTAMRGGLRRNEVVLYSGGVFGKGRD